MELETLQKYLPHRLLNARIRRAAIKRVKKDLILAGRKESELSEDDLEYLVADAEKDVVNQLKQTTLLGALALLGIGYF